MKHDIQQLIGNTLRRGVTIAFVIALSGGLFYLAQHGREPLPDYTRFASDEADTHTHYTTLRGILSGLLALNSASWMQAGVVALILTPILRVLLTFVDFAAKRDWLYMGITATVLVVILANSLGGK